MSPLDIFFISIAIFFIFVAVVRHYPRELGVTTLVFVALFTITYFLIPQVPRLLDAVTEALNRAPIDARTEQHIMAASMSILLIAIVFASYAGETLAFKGQPATGVKGVAIDSLVGLLNGYLVAGTLWYLQDFYQYPIADFKNAAGNPIFLDLPLTPFAETMAQFLPPYVVPAMFWAVMVIVMLLARVRR